MNMPDDCDKTRGTVPAKSRCRVGLAPALTLFFAIFVGVLTFVAVRNPELFGSLMFEDHWGEWATFHAFVLGGTLGLLGLVRQHRQANITSTNGSHERFFRFVLICISFFCLLAAGEEISWGQRLLGVLPPDVFQKLNYQQELNVHNILAYFISARFVVGLICFGYGVLLPIVTRYGKTKSAEQSDAGPASALDLVAPPLFLCPWFALTGAIYWAEPMMMSLEAAELLLALLILTDIVCKCQPRTSEPQQLARQSARAVVVIAVPLALGALTNPLIDRFLRGTDEALVAQARNELAEIAWDLQHAGAIHSEISRHDRVFDSRIYDAVREDLIRFTDSSRFYGARLDYAPGTTESRRRSYFLDPWSNPYWICRKGRGPVHLYSFGPDRRLDTLVLFEERIPDESDLRGDDIGIWGDLNEG